ncbi:hypothetical protein DFJ43DRAFT_1040177 [Lentinula guzmanii]|uniref:Uncharacterized protein n=1 Tax=Lentinula guzmanii TaxID=2804957 RepID=A0AA38N0H2_9AGAR|nr:hypothetical protein DFJ43DRAFT_1040177 [Lentinula guzmanii]
MGSTWTQALTGAGQWFHSSAHTGDLRCLLKCFSGAATIGRSNGFDDDLLGSWPFSNSSLKILLPYEFSDSLVSRKQSGAGNDFGGVNHPIMAVLSGTHFSSEKTPLIPATSAACYGYVKTATATVASKQAVLLGQTAAGQGTSKLLGQLYYSMGLWPWVDEMLGQGKPKNETVLIDGSKAIPPVPQKMLTIALLSSKPTTQGFFPKFLHKW